MWTIKNRTNNRGYTLIEMAVVMVIAGIVVSGAVAAYTLYLKDSRQKHTTRAMQSAQQAIGGYRALYGRYPCPASPTAAPGDVDYGYQDCAGASLLSATSTRTPALADPDIMIGTIPFRELNISENTAYDGYNNRLTYAVTASLVNDTTYDNSQGGISLVDGAGTSVIDPADSAHFVVISHGPNGEGAYSRFGVLTTCPSGPSEEENCNDDSVFTVSAWADDFDDEIVYEIPLPMQEWQYSNTDPNQIHLRRADSVTLGANVADDLSGEPAFAVLDGGIGEQGRIRVEDGVALASELCPELGGGVDCFQPSVVAGNPAFVGGLLCPVASPYLIAVENSTRVCTDELTFSCPAGQFMKGVNATGQIVCAASPSPGCAAQTMTSYCGDTRTLPAAAHGASSYIYSGDYYTITPWAAGDTAAVSAAPNFAAIQTYINTRNSAIRTAVDAGPGVGTGMVRERFDCTAGTWSSTAVRRHRRPITTGGWASTTAATNAHQSVARAYTPMSPMTVDPSNNTAHTAAQGHHCWCREDFRATNVACAAGYTGFAFYVMQYPCPKTNNSFPSDWVAVLGSAGAPITTGCTCTPGNYDTTATCASHYGRPTSQISGNMTTSTSYSCSGGVAVPGPATTTHNCRCLAQAPNPQVTTTACPTGTGNSFTFGGVNYTNVATISHNTWTCPTGMGGPVNSSADLGSWSGSTVVHTQACVCTPLAPMLEEEFCNATNSALGGKIIYEREWSCALGAYEPDADRSIHPSSPGCHPLRWHAPTGAAQYLNYAPAARDGNSCAGQMGNTAQCWTTSPSAGYYWVYDDCECR